MYKWYDNILKLLFDDSGPLIGSAYKLLWFGGSKWWWWVGMSSMSKSFSLYLNSIYLFMYLLVKTQNKM